MTITARGVPASAQALVPPASTAAAKRAEIRLGMTSDEVRRLLGDPDAEVVFGDKTRWSYPGMSVVFANGKVTELPF